jgi:hypothetical protein
VGEARGETNRTCLRPWVGKGGPMRLVDGGIEPTVGAGGGGGAPVRKRARGVGVFTVSLPRDTLR